MFFTETGSLRDSDPNQCFFAVFIYNKGWVKKKTVAEGSEINSKRDKTIFPIKFSNHVRLMKDKTR